MKTILRYLANNFKSPLSFIPVIFCLSFQSIFGLTSDFSIQVYNKCSPTVVVFINESTTGPGIEYLWDFGKGALILSPEMILTEAFTDPGTYEISLRVIEGTDTVRSSQILQIAAGPKSSFSIDADQGCIPLEVQFTNTSAEGDAPIHETFWDFRNGDTGYGDEYNYSYTQPGMFDVYMSVTDENRCSDYTESFGLIRVFDTPEVNFTASDSFACYTPLIVDFTNLSNGVGNLSSQWFFGNNTTSDEFNGTAFYTNPGIYDVELHITDANGCTDSISKEEMINVGENTGDIYATSSGNTYFEDNSLLCPGTIGFGTTLPGQADYTWIIDYNNTVHTYEDVESIVFAAIDSGSIEIKLLYGLSTECPDSITKSFRIDHVISDFSMDSYYTCELPVDIALTNLSENAVSYKWRFPDLSSSNETDPVYTMSLFATHKYLYNHERNEYHVPILLIAENGNGCTDSARYEYEVSLPVARFMPDISGGCVPLELTFSDSSRSKDPITEWTYLIEELEYPTSEGNPLSYTFNTPGIYPVQLVIRNDQNCIDTSYSVVIEVGDKINPFFSVSPENLCYGNTIDLTDESPSQDLIDSWQYSSPGLFNTGAITSPDATVTINAPSSDLKDIKLTVDYNGCLSDTVLKDIIDVYDPTGNINYRFDCDSPMVYTLLTDIQDADEFTWLFDDTIFINTDSIVYEFNKTGLYEIILQATNTSSNCTIEKSIFIPVRNVQANFTFNPYVCLYDSAEYNAVSSIDYIDECYIEGFLWDFGDESPPRRTWDTLHKHAYSETGIYFPQLIVTADNGCTDTLTGVVKVVEPPVSFEAMPTSGCGPELSVQFAFEGTYPSLDEWIWDFGDDSRDTTQNSHPEHTYSAGIDLTFVASLLVKDIYGCTNSAMEEITVYSPTIYFQALESGVCLGEEVNFIISESDITSFEWDFGDGTGSTTTNSHLYTEAGEYSVQLTAERHGCELDVIRPSYISVQEADASFLVSDNSFECYPATVSFNHINTPANIMEGVWTFAEGSESQDYSPVTEYTYSQPGTYTASLYIMTSNSCTAFSSQTIEVTGPEVDFHFEPAFICNGDSVSFEITDSDNVDEFQWVFGDGSTSADPTPTHAYFATGEIYPAIWVRDGECEVTITDEPLYVSYIRAAFELSPVKENYCYYDPILTNNQSVDYNYSVWSINGVPVSTDQNIEGVHFDATGPVHITLEVSNGIGCSDTIEKNYNVVELPQFTISGETRICEENNSTLFSITGNPDWSVTWSPAQLFSSPTSLTTTVSPDSTLYITATVTDDNECSAPQSQLITVIGLPEILRIPLQDTAIVIGETIQLIVLSDFENSLYSWSPGYQISCTSCNDPIVNPFESTYYRVEITDECRTSLVEFYVEVLMDHYLELPTAFTPNGDNENDIFAFESEKISEVDFKIFNRWGNLVYSSTSLTEGWNGYYEGKLQNTDTYTYYIHATTEHGYEFGKKGTFLLLR